MEIYVLNKSYQIVGLVDIFESFIWTDRYCGYGDFELYTGITPELVDLLQQDYYLKIADSDHLMIVEDIQIITDVEKGNKLKVSGRSLESILDRRIVMFQTQIDGNMQDGIHTLMNDAFISPVVPNGYSTNRTVSNMIFQTSTDTRVTSPVMTASYWGEYIYDIVKQWAGNNNLGFSMLLNSSNQFVFGLYAGTNRSYNQSTNPYVVFSPKFDNLLNSNYYESKRFFKTANISHGDASDGNTPIARGWIYGGTELAGIDHREVYYDFSSISKYISGVLIPSADYLKQIGELAKAKRTVENSMVRSFDGQVEDFNFKYRSDYFLGDLVQLENEYGFQGISRITEVTISENLNGHFIYPTFVIA